MEQRWLKLKDAAKYSAIGRHRLMALAAEGQVVGFKDTDSGCGDWIFDRESLDSYRLSQYTIPALHERALKILRK